MPGGFSVWGIVGKVGVEGDDVLDGIRNEGLALLDFVAWPERADEVS